MILHIRSLKALDKLFREYVNDDKLEEFLNKLANAPGTNSSFKYVFRDLLEYVEKDKK